MITVTAPKTKFELITAFNLYMEVTVKLSNMDRPVTGTIMSLEHEDGSGNSFNGMIYETKTGKRFTGYLGRFQ